MLNFQQNIQSQNVQQQPGQTASAQTLPSVNQPAARNSRKRKSPPTELGSAPPPPPPPSQVQQQQQQQQLQHVIPPPHPMMHPMPPGTMPPYQYDYSPGGIAAPAPPPQDPNASSSSSRPLSSSKRAEQNRKAQRAFRERRDQHVKALESRSQLLDAALASADEANRRWEECRVLVDQLRVENTALRAALAQAQGHGQQVQVLGAGVVMQGDEHKKDDSGEDHKE